MATTAKLPERSSKPNFLAVDFFCGAGGTTRGLIDAGGYVVAGIDNDANCGQTFVQNNKNLLDDLAYPKFLNFDIFPATKDYPAGQQTKLMHLLFESIREARIRCPDVPLLFAICAPCQPFTTVSKNALTEFRKTKRKRDRNLLDEAINFVCEFEPDYVLSENVATIQSERYGGVWDRFRHSLDTLGYTTGSGVVCASKFGVPQFRKRSILLASARCAQSPLAKTTPGGSELVVPREDPNEKIATVRETIEYLPALGAGVQHPSIANHRTRWLSDLNIKRISVAKPGESNQYMENTKFGDLSLDCHKRVNGRLGTRCFNDVYTRMEGDKPAPTITTKCHSISNGRFGHYDINQNRGISLKEAALLQSFPKDYTFYPTDKTQRVAVMIGNAVPPKLARFFASYLVGS